MPLYIHGKYPNMEVTHSPKPAKYDNHGNMIAGETYGSIQFKNGRFHTKDDLEIQIIENLPDFKAGLITKHTGEGAQHPATPEDQAPVTKQAGAETQPDVEVQGDQENTTDDSSCPHCDKVCKNKAGLTAHIRQKHPEAPVDELPQSAKHGPVTSRDVAGRR